MRMLVLAAAAALALAPLSLAACDGGGGGGDAGSDETGGGPVDDGGDGAVDDTGDAPADTPVDDPVDDTADETAGDTADETPGFDPATCAPTVSGTLMTDAGDVDLGAAAVTLSGAHQVADGCLTEVKLAVTAGEGCAIDLTIEGGVGAWGLTGGSFEVGDACGLAVPSGTWVLSSVSSTAALLEPPVIAAETADVCLEATGLDLIGLARFELDADVLEVDLSGLAFGGTLHAGAAAEAGACPAAVTVCDSLTCGADKYGVACGTCAEDEVCESGACASKWCPPPQFGFGTHPGDTLADVVVYDCDGQEVHLHELCGAKAGYFNLLAGW